LAPGRAAGGVEEGGELLTRRFFWADTSDREADGQAHAFARSGGVVGIWVRPDSGRRGTQLRGCPPALRASSLMPLR